MSLGRILCLLALAQKIHSRLIKSMEVYWTVPDQPLQLMRCGGWSCAQDMVVSEDGLFLITSHDKEVCFWEMPSCSVDYVEAHCEETKMIVCRTMPSSSSALALVRDFALAVAVKNEVYFWQLHPLQLKIGTTPRLLTHDADVLLLANDGHQLLTGCANSVLTMYWLYADENSEATISWRLHVTDDQGEPQRLTALALQRGGTRWLAVGADPPHSSPTSRLMIWKLSSFSPPSLQPQYTATHISSVLSIAFHPSLPWIYTGTRQGRLTTWHYTSQDGHPMQQRGVDYSVTHLQFSASGGFLLSGGNTGIAELWDGDQQAATTFKYAGSIRGWTFSADEAFVLANLANSAEEASLQTSPGLQGAADVILAFPLDLRFPRSGFQLGLHRVVGGPLVASPNGFFLLDAHYESPHMLSLWDVRGRMTVPVTDAHTNISLVDLVHFRGTDSVLVGGNTELAADSPKAVIQQWRMPWKLAVYQGSWWYNLRERQMQLEGVYHLEECKLSSLAIAEAFQQFAAGCEGSTIRFVEKEDFAGKVVRIISLPSGQVATALAFHDKTLFVGTQMGAVCSHSLEEDSMRSDIQAVRCQFPGGRINVLRAMPSASEVFSGGDNGRICKSQFLGHEPGNITCVDVPGMEPRGVLSLQLYRNSTKLASSSINGALAVWDLTLPAELQLKPLEWFQSLDYYMTMTISPDGAFFYTTGTLGGISARYVDSVPAAVRRLKSSPLCRSNICTTSSVTLQNRDPVDFPAYLEVTPLRYLNCHSGEIVSMPTKPPVSMRLVNLSNAVVHYWLSMGESWYSTPTVVDLRDTDVVGIPILHGEAVRLVTDRNCIDAAKEKASKIFSKLDYCILRSPQQGQLCASHFVSHDMSREALSANVEGASLPRMTEIWIDHDDFPAWLCDCPAGRYGPNGTDCQLCKDNHYCPAAGDGDVAENAQAKPCPPRSGSTATGLVNLSSCECLPGFYEKGEGPVGGPMCETCPSGESTFGYGQTLCMSCTFGYRPLARSPHQEPPVAPPPGRVLEASEELRVSTKTSSPSVSVQPLARPSECYPDWYGMGFVCVLQVAVSLTFWGLQRHCRGLEIKDVSLDRGNWVCATAGRRNIVIWPGVLDRFSAVFRDTGNPYLDMEITTDLPGEQPDGVQALPGVGGLRMVLLRNGRELDTLGPRLDTSRGFVNFRGPWLWLLSGRYVPNVLSVPFLLIVAQLLLTQSYFRKFWVLFGLASTSVIGLIMLLLMNCCSSQSALNYLLTNFSRQLPKPLSVLRGPQRAIRLDSILELHHHFRFIIGDRDMYYVTSNILHPLTKPPLAKSRYSYAEVAGPVRATFFVSHYWGMPFEHSVKSLSKHAQLADQRDFKQTSYWVCSFAINQHSIEEELGGGDLFQSSFYMALVDPRTRATVMLLDDEATPLTRVWCLFEVLQTFILSHQQPGFQGLLLCTPSGVLNQSSNVSVDMAITVARRLTHLRLEDAKASKAADKQTIDDLVSSYEGGHEAMNHFVREHIHNALKRIKKQHNQTFDQLMRELQRSERTGGRRSATVPAQVSSSRSGSLVLSSRGIPQSPASSLRSDDEACSSDESSDDKELRSAGNPPEGGWQSWVSAHLGSRFVSIPTSLFSRRHWEEPGP